MGGAGAIARSRTRMVDPNGTVSQRDGWSVLTASPIDVDPASLKREPTTNNVWMITDPVIQESESQHMWDTVRRKLGL
jgi:hypothetical protein